MDGGFSYGDIIVLGAIAAFILLRYRAMLGQPRERDETRPPAHSGNNELGRVLQLPISRPSQAETKPNETFAEHGILAKQFVAMRAVDAEFSPDDFLHGARTAYEMVIEAFSKRNHDTLKMLLSPEIYERFSQSIKQAEEEKRFHDTTLVAITLANITAATLAGTQATLTVAFKSEQIHLIRDAEGVIIEGNASHEHSVNDEWVFTRDLKNASPNWQIIDT